MNCLNFLLILNIVLATSFHNSNALEAVISSEVLVKVIKTMEDIYSQVCVDCFGRNLMAMFNCLAEEDLVKRTIIIRSYCPAAPRFFARHLKRRIHKQRRNS